MGIEEALSLLQRHRQPPELDNALLEKIGSLSFSFNPAVVQAMLAQGEYPGPVVQNVLDELGIQASVPTDESLFLKMRTSLGYGPVLWELLEPYVDNPVSKKRPILHEESVPSDPKDRLRVIVDRVFG